MNWYTDSQHLPAILRSLARRGLRVAGVSNLSVANSLLCPDTSQKDSTGVRPYRSSQYGTYAACLFLLLLFCSSLPQVLILDWLGSLGLLETTLEISSQKSR